jgi:endonuclease/exonuclease/phosphatase family metal-dependent hydrolase
VSGGARGLGVSVALALSALTGWAQDMTVVTWNVQNYTLTSRRIEEGFRPDYPKPEAEKAALRRALRALAADVVVLQEIGGEAFARELQRDLAAEGLRYDHAEAMLAVDAERGLGVLCRQAPSEVRRHTDLEFMWAGVPTRVRRGLLEVAWAGEAGAPPWRIFVAHLKSRRTEDDADPLAAKLRAAEAVAVRERIIARMAEVAGEPTGAVPGARAVAGRFLILGDLNDSPGSRPVEAMGARGKLTIAEWLDAADERGHRWTHAHAAEANYSRLDHAFASCELRPAVQRAWIVDSPDTAAASDHRPVVLRLAW